MWITEAKSDRLVDGDSIAIIIPFTGNIPGKLRRKSAGVLGRTHTSPGSRSTMNRRRRLPDAAIARCVKVNSQSI